MKNEHGQAAFGVAGVAVKGPGTVKGMHEEFKKIARAAIDNVRFFTPPCPLPFLSFHTSISLTYKLSLNLSTPFFVTLLSNRSWERMVRLRGPS